jgi:hypothetical protein
MADPQSAVRREILAEFQKSRNVSSWPTIHLDRTIAALEAAAGEIQQESNRKEREKAARQRAKKLVNMATDPTPTLSETERLVQKRSTDAYNQAATLLADLREAIASSSQSGLAEQQARMLKDTNPTLRMLTTALRSKGLLR